jgi:hypothetical protein
VKEPESRIIDTQKDMEQKRELGRLGAISRKRNKLDIDIRLQSEDVQKGENFLTKGDEEKLSRFELDKRRDLAARAPSSLRLGQNINLSWDSATTNPTLKSFLSYDEF